MRAQNDSQSAQTTEAEILSLNKRSESLMDSDPACALSLAETALKLLATFDPSPFKDQQTALAIAMLGLAEFKMSNSATAIEHLAKAKKMAEGLNDLPLTMRILGALGNAHWNLANYAEALRLHHQRLAIAESLNDDLNIATSQHNIGNVYFQLAQYDKALQAYQTSLAIKEKLSNELEIASTLMNIGNVYYLIGDIENAQIFYERNLALKRKNFAPPSSLAHSLVNLGNIYHKQANYEDALRHYEEAYHVLENFPDSLVRAQILGNIASALAGMGKLEEALNKHLECLQIREKIGHKQGIIIAHNAIGLSCSQLGRFEEAERYLFKALELAKEHDTKRDIAEAHESLAKHFKAKQDYQKSLEHYEQYHLIDKQAFDEGQAKRLREMQAMHETEQARKETELEKERNAELQKALDEAEKQKQLALEANGVKTQLLSIAAHDLKSPLQSVIGFSALIKETPETEIKSVYEYATHIESAANRMLNLINEILKSNEFEIADIALNLKPYRLDNILRDAVYENQVIAKKKSQTILLNHIEEISLNLDASKMREVIDNLLSNAMKYSPREKNIAASLTKLPLEKSRLRRASDVNQHMEAVARLSIKDEGQGLSENDLKKLFGRFQRLSARPTDEEGSTGLGLFIVKKIVELHGGRVWAESEGKGKGATFFVEIPIRIAQEV